MSTDTFSNTTHRQMTIKLRDQYGSVITGRSLASKLRQEIEAETHGGHDVWVDFDGIVAISPSAGDEIFAKLDRSGPGRAHFENMPSSVEALAKFVVANRTGQAQ
jgi:hypothetical protein